MQPENRKTLSPAAILLCLRDTGPKSIHDLTCHFGMLPIYSYSDSLRQLGEMKRILLRFVKAGLVKGIRSQSVDCHDNDVSRDVLFTVTPLLTEIQKALDLSLTQLAAAAASTESDLSFYLRNLEKSVAESISPETSYRTDLLNSLSEMRVCFEAECYLAVLCLAGKCLEICLKARLVLHGLPFDENCMLGVLLGKLKDTSGEYRNPALINVANVINQSRISAVHCKRAVATPSREIAAMVINAVTDVIKRTFTDSNITHPTSYVGSEETSNQSQEIDFSKPRRALNQRPLNEHRNQGIRDVGIRP